MKYFKIVKFKSRNIYRQHPSGKLELLLSCGWHPSQSDELTGLGKISESEAKRISKIKPHPLKWPTDKQKKSSPR